MNTEQEIRVALTRTWHTFFARFPKLRMVQRASILPILSGAKILLNAPTAAGKTEAIVAPLLERLLRMSAPLQENPQLLIVAPTKALCNDLFRRLDYPFQRLGLLIDLKTGDAPFFNEKKPPFALITTPESLDSMLSRGAIRLRYLRAVMIDEIHLMAQSGRGDQLQCLLVRLQRLVDHEIQFCASSATIPEIEKLGKSFLGEGSRIIEVKAGARSINASFAQCFTEQDVASVLSQLMLEERERKTLVFTNSRAEVETLVRSLSLDARLSGKVFAHHGSMSKDERLRTEKEFLRARSAICIATSTLELGIDIGDVNRTVLVGAPANVSSLVQRIGRGNRQERAAQVLCLHETEFEGSRFMHMLECAKKGLIFPDPVAFRPTTLVQQAVSIMFQNPKCWISARSLFERIAAEAQELYKLEGCEAVLLKMQEIGWVREISRQRFVPEEKLVFLFDRGLIHSMIESKGETDVVDAMTGRTIGSIKLAKQSRLAISLGLKPSISLAGRGHEAAYIKEDKLYVQSTGVGERAQFVSHEAPRYSLSLARDFASFLGIKENSLPVEEFEEKRFIISHFLGSIGALLLLEYLQSLGAEVIARAHTPFHLTLSKLPNVQKLGSVEELSLHFERSLKNKASFFAKSLQPGPNLNLIPSRLIQTWIRASVPVEKYAQTLANAEFC